MRHGKIITAITSMVFVHFLSATQVIPNPVNPQIGENLWQMNYRQSIAIDDIMDTTTLCCNCDFFITQADIDLNGGGFNITQPGNWCLAENIVTTQPISITALPGLVFDLKGRAIRSSVNNGAIIEVNACPSIIIKNGTITGSDLTGAATVRWAIRLTDSPDCLVSNVRATFLSSADNTAPQQSIGFSVNPGTTGANFNKCFATGPSLTGFITSGINSVFSNCEVNHFSGDIIGANLVSPELAITLREAKHI